MSTGRQREYREVYLQSDHWRRIREIALGDFEYRCAVCYSPKNLDVHHRTYERLGNERVTDLTVLCRSCHELFHANGAVKKPRQKKLATKKQIAYIVKLGGAPTEGMTQRQARAMTSLLQKKQRLKVPRGTQVLSELEARRRTRNSA